MVKNLIQILADLYGNYIKDVVQFCTGKEIIIPKEVEARVIEVAMFAERVRLMLIKTGRVTLIEYLSLLSLCE